MSPKNQLNPQKQLKPRRLIGWPQIVTAAFYLGCILLALAMSGLTNYINSRPFVYAQSGDQKQGMSKSLDAFMATSSLFTTLATGLLAGLGLFITSRPRESFPLRHFWLAALSFACVCVSLYWGYITAQNVEWAIENLLSLGLDEIQLPRELQCFTMLLGVIFFADFVRRDLTKVD
jgi:hypothetical protein